MKKSTLLSLLAALILVFTPMAVNAQETYTTPTPTPTPISTTTSTSSTSVGESTTSADQPVLPDELPQTGPEDWLKWIVSGIALIGIGLLLF